MKYIIILLCFLFGSCSKKINIADIKTPLISKLSKTTWKIDQSGKENRIQFGAKKLKLWSSSILAAPFTEYHVVSEDTNFVLLSIYSNIDPRLLAIELIDAQTILVLVMDDMNLTASTAKNLIQEYGQIYKLTK